MDAKLGCPSSAPWAIEVRGLTKAFGDHLALRGVELAVQPGEFVSILGPNGAGKTTLIKVLATLLRPSAGTVRVAGFDLQDASIEIRCRIGVVLQDTLLYDHLTAYENLRFYGRMFAVPNLEHRIHEVVAMVGLASRLHHPVRTLSHGMQQRLAIARAVIHCPPIMLLDEPETGLDQHTSAMLGEVLQAHNGSRPTVLMTTHSLERGLAMGDRIVILSEGKIVYQEARRCLDLAMLRECYYSLTAAR